MYSRLGIFGMQIYHLATQVVSDCLRRTYFMYLRQTYVVCGINKFRDQCYYFHEKNGKRAHFDANESYLDNKRSQHWFQEKGPK
jgi:hypothetical protein